MIESHHGTSPDLFIQSDCISILIQNTFSSLQLDRLWDRLDGIYCQLLGYKVSGIASKAQGEHNLRA